MPATGWLRRNRLEAVLAAFLAANLVVMLVWPSFVRLPFFLTWIGLTLVYGFHPWRPYTTMLAVAGLSLATLAVILADGFKGDELWGNLVTVPLLAVMFGAMAWHARRRATAQAHAEATAETRASLLGRQQQFVYDASHELRTPVTIARGHLELLRRESPGTPEIEVAVDELDRMERIVERLLLLARAEQPEFLAPESIDIESFLEDVFMRWSEVAPHAWRLELDVTGIVWADPGALRNALDALLENAVKYTEPHAAIVVRATAVSGDIVVEVANEGQEVPEDGLHTIFDRFARADDARTRAHGGVGLGLSIVAAIARAHGGTCTVERRGGETVFALRLPVVADGDDEPAAEILGAMDAAAGLAS
ncbi:MAG TPA: HAMP domain-containing sensor histidine kinase [Gaiellaceae bacterium]|nr:HAMP domain-containing sensor histidine kinase [Gaiellaceae bacterium]